MSGRIHVDWVTAAVAWFVVCFWVMVVYGLWCSFAAWRSRRAQARFDRARDTQGSETL